MSEETSVGNVSHKKLNNNEVLIRRLIKTRCRLRWRGSSDGLLQVCVCFRVVQLHSADAAKVVVVSGELSVACRCRESGFGDQLVSLVVEVITNVASEQTVNESSLRFIVVAEGRCSLSCQEQSLIEWLMK